LGFGPTYINWQIFMLYDKIYNRKYANPTPFRIPICVCLYNSTDNEAYLFFNNNMNKEEASIILKAFLGIKDNEFELEQPLQIVPIKDEKTPEETTTGEKYLNPTFVKIFKKFIGWTIKSGTVIDYTTKFDEVATVEHKIKKGSINIKNICHNFMGLNQVVNDNVLPELYKDYVTTEDKSEKYGFQPKDYVLFTQRYLEQTRSEAFETIKGKDPINLNLVRARLLFSYPYIEKRWWEKEETKRLAQEGDEMQKAKDEAAAARKRYEEAWDNEHAPDITDGTLADAPALTSPPSGTSTVDDD